MTEPTDEDVERALTRPTSPVVDALEDDESVVEAMADDVTSPALNSPDAGPGELSPPFQEPPEQPSS